MTLYAFEGHRPEVDPTAWVAADANLIGRVVVGAEGSVWFGATLRGDNEPIVIGDRSNVQENVVMHTDMGFPLTVGRGCTIGHLALLHGCTIGDNSLVGMGATIMNGAVIGKNCMIGAGALITEGKQIPDGSLVVGAPARVVRPLDADAIAGLEASAQGYVDKSARFRTGLEPL